jgi:spore maturation protein SpmA
MLNFIWLALIGLAVLIGGLTGRIGDAGQGALDFAYKAVFPVGLSLLAAMTLWLGLMRLAEKSGLVHRLGQAVKPIMIWLFPEVPPDHPAMGAMIMNMAANILGLNNAATPLGLRAMSELDKLNPRPGVATNAMCMLLAINTSSITLIPVSVIALLMSAHSKNPTVIIGTSLAATTIAHAAAILTCKLLERSPWFRLPPITETASATKDAASETTDAGQKVAEDATMADQSLPWVPGSKWILAAAAGAFLGMMVGIAFPEVLTQVRAILHPLPLPFGWQYPATTDPTLPVQIHSHFFLWRLVEALSLLALPWLIFFFPLYAALRRIPVYDEFVEGAKEGFQVFLRILPYMVGMLAAVGMFQGAGGMTMVTSLLKPLTDLLHFPSELVPLAIIRPFSGTAAYGVLADLVNNPQFGPDSLIALTAATFYGCSETTFYVIAVYFGSVKIRRTRHAIPAGLVADVVGPIASVLICRAVFGA